MSADKLTYLKAAIQAKMDYWDANRALERMLGFEDVPDDVNDYIEDQISTFASVSDNAQWIGEAELAEFLEGMPT